MKKLILLSLLSLNIHASVNYDQLSQLKEAIYLAFDELKPDSSHSLSINQKVGDLESYWWDLDIVHASYSGVEQDGLFSHNIFLFGGFARLDGMTLDGLALTACHEIGHGIGGLPLKVNGKTMEGQADYYATQTCLPILFKYLKQADELSTDPYIEYFCKSHTDYSYCQRAMTALESEIFFFSYLGDETSFEERSTEVVTELNTSETYYPSAQCRLDTSMNGIFGLARPTCWFPKN
ncbi:hypothetical protein A9Q84_19825 [Halobacteriovorax marinus]|uniref:Uncharacterized protein n=1 Tax=Halobacteriovorax marinus TaxID=97084 RepID=A0A1Y5F397_9BACT|nr:hypothetical protein A9Q84_19825 [Halobacteriovorax marinus]